jgi:hypothetical protein
LPYFGWGDIPDQYRRLWDGDDGESPRPRRPSRSDLPPLLWHWRQKGSGDRPTGCRARVLNLESSPRRRHDTGDLPVLEPSSARSTAASLLRAEVRMSRHNTVRACCAPGHSGQTERTLLRNDRGKLLAQAVFADAGLKHGMTSEPRPPLAASKRRVQALPAAQALDPRSMPRGQAARARPCTAGSQRNRRQLRLVFPLPTLLPASATSSRAC